MLLLAPASGYSPKGSPTTFATFNNAHTKELIKAWKPRPLPSAAPQGDGLMPSSKDNMRRFVRARILLEDPSCGCVASFNTDKTRVSVILCRFTKAEHQLLLPLWQPDTLAAPTFHHLLAWHKESFGGAEAEFEAVLSGAKLEWPDDRQAWVESGGLGI